MAKRINIVTANKQGKTDLTIPGWELSQLLTSKKIQKVYQTHLGNSVMFTFSDNTQMLFMDTSKGPEIVYYPQGSE